MLHCTDKLRFFRTRSAIYPIRTQHYGQCQVAPYATPIQMGLVWLYPVWPYSLDWGSAVNATHRPLCPLYKRLDECQGRCEWSGEEGVSFPTGARILNRPAHSELIYRLNYPIDVDPISQFCAFSLFVSNVWNTMSGLQFVPNFVKIVQLV
jgi:hypothetical protein